MMKRERGSGEEGRRLGECLLEEVGFEGLSLNDGRVFACLMGLGESVPERGCFNREGPVAPGPELGPGGFESGDVWRPEGSGR